MKPLSVTNLRGRVLVVGGKDACSQLLEKLSSEGFFCAGVTDPGGLVQAATQLRPEAILLSAPATRAGEALDVIRAHRELRDLPVLADLSRGKTAAGLRRLQLEDYVHSVEDLTVRLEAALRAKRLADRELAAQHRMEMLLEITQAATSSLELEQILDLAVERLSRVVENDRCSVVLVEGQSPRLARVVSSRGVTDLAPFQVDLARYPELRRALETRQPVCVDDATRDPLMEDVRRHIVPLGVRSVLVQPLIANDEMLGALFLRLSKKDEAFTREDQDFAQAVAAALSNSVRNARLHSALRRKREELESAYVDRYRELSDANRRLKDMNRLKDEVIAVCSHDLRAPLQVLLGHGRLLLDDPAIAGQHRASTEAIVRTGKKILELVESLLERGKGDQTRISLDARTVDVAELCKETAAELDILARQRGVRLRAETPESLTAIADELKLRQVLQNLITNAIDHAQDAGEVVVRTQRLRRPDADVARVVVQDNGRGIPADQLPLVFDRYRTGKEGGTGLGLSICREFVELHGGEIWAEAPPDGGCAFVFTVPLAVDDLPLGQPPTVGVRDGGAAARVLIVEDEPEIATAAAEILRSRYRVEVARDGQEGLARARDLTPDLIVMDVFLPKLDGLDAAAALKASSDTADIPVILLSAHQGVAAKVRGLNLGAVDYLGKPFQPVELLTRVDRALQLRSAELELRRSQSLLRRAGSDPQTGLLDRAGFVTRLDQEIARSQRYERQLAVAVVVPDGPLGEHVRAAASVLRGRLRAPDVIAHLGGGVLGVVLPESSAERARQVFSRLQPELQAVTGLRFRSAALAVDDCDGGAESHLERLLSSISA